MPTKRSPPSFVKTGRKTCPRCHRNRSIRFFAKSTRALSGLQTRCKTCTHEVAVASRLANPDRRRQIELRSRARHPYSATYKDCARRAFRDSVPICAKPTFLKWNHTQARVCVYCGLTEPKAQRLFSHRLHVDRKEAAMGYILGNMCLACQRCNLTKNGYLSSSEMILVGDLFFRGPQRTDPARVRLALNAHGDLLAACETALDVQCSGCYVEDSPCGNCPALPRRNQYCAAIAKAKGE